MLSKGIIRSGRSSKLAAALVCLAAASAMRAQSTLSFPAWLEVYPGAAAKTQTTPGLLEATYATPAKPVEVIAHYRKLFQTAGLSFQPGFDGMGTVIRGAAPEGDLLISIRPQGSLTAVRVDLTAKAAEFTPSAPPAATPASTSRSPYLKNRAEIDAYNEQRRAEIEEKKRRGAESMEKYDKPFYPSQRPKIPDPVWPAWLVHVDGAPLQIVKSTEIGLKTLSTSFATNSDRNAVQGFYASVLTANGYQIRQQSGAGWPRHLKAWIEAADHPMGEGPLNEIRIEIGPYADSYRVVIRLTVRP